MRRSLPVLSIAVGLAAFSTAALAPLAAKADDAPATPTLDPAPAASASASVDTSSILPEAPPEAPPPLPHKKGLVLETSLGALGFSGQFRHVAPTAFWLHAQLGYEFLSWLMAFGETELAYTDTSVAQDPSKAHSFPIFGFGGGVRATIHVSERVGIFGQVGIGAMRADVPKQALTILGYRDAESYNPYFGGRLGVEWYQVDRHMAIGALGGLRDAQGFSKITKDTPLMWDGAVTLRYTF